VTIDSLTPVDNLGDIIACEFYTLPILTNGNYFTQSSGLGNELFTGDELTTSQTVYIYFESVSCSDESSFTLTIDSTICEEVILEEDSCTAKFPKFITPNGDGINDSFNIIENECNTNGELRIYDRYGKLVFQTKDLNRGWDGTINGTSVPASDYWYQYIDEENNELVTNHFALKR